MFRRQRFNTLINRDYFDRHLNNLRYLRDARTRLAFFGLNCNFGNIHFEFDIDRDLTNDGIKDNLHRQLYNLSIIDNHLVVRHVDSIVNGVGQYTLNRSIGIVNSVIGIFYYCFLLFVAGFV